MKDTEMNDNDKNNDEMIYGGENPVTPVELDELILDRLVDDDLSEEEYREVLRLVEEKPDGWRQLALAFLESQAFEKDLLALNQFPSEQMSDANQELERGDSKRLLAGSNPEVTGKAKPVAQPSHLATQNDAGFWKSVRTTLPALAACIAIAVTAGLYIREIQDRNGIQTVDSGQRVDATDPDFIELVSNDPEGRVLTPVFNHQDFDPGNYAREVKALKPRLQEVVDRSGWSANERTHVVPIKDKTGNRIIVPLNEIKLTPNSFEKYQ